MTFVQVARGGTWQHADVSVALVPDARTLLLLGQGRLGTVPQLIPRLIAVLTTTFGQVRVPTAPFHAHRKCMI